VSDQWQGLEQRLSAQCELLERRGRGVVTRCRPDVQVVRSLKGGRVEGFVTGSRLDFEGVLRPSGRAVVIEAKTSHASPSWPLCDVRDAQVVRMAQLASCGALALLYVQRWHEGRATDYLLPVDAQGRIASLVTHPALLVLSAERKSIRWADLEPWRVGPQELWLDAAERLGLLGGA
jgi:penicillin-binding protein-related factor A (putative recombinase)